MRLCSDEHVVFVFEVVLGWQQFIIVLLELVVSLSFVLTWPRDCYKKEGKGHKGTIYK